jgi:hypothetical protein
MDDRCGTECEVDADEAADAAFDEAMGEVLRHATTEQLRDALRALGWRVILEADP